MSVSQSATVPDTTASKGDAIAQQITQKTTQAPKMNRTASNNGSELCWIELKQYPYQPDHQVELLHLQAEADALLMKLKNDGKKQS